MPKNKLYKAREPFPAAFEAELGKCKDSDISLRSGVSLYRVRQARMLRKLHNPARAKWTPKIDMWLGKIPDRAIVEKFKLTVGPAAVAARRAMLGIPRPNYTRITWTPELDAKLGKELDTAIAELLECHPATVGSRRRALGIACFKIPT
jgi:hypothetical protein